MSLVATTDIRSPKVRELREVSDQASICWWHPTPNTQFRIKGAVRVIGPEEAGWDDKRKETWDKMSGHLRATFARPNAPGSPMDRYEQGEEWEETIPASEEASLARVAIQPVIGRADGCVRLPCSPAPPSRTPRPTARRRPSGWPGPTLRWSVAFPPHAHRFRWRLMLCASAFACSSSSTPSLSTTSSSPSSRTGTRLGAFRTTSGRSRSWCPETLARDEPLTLDWGSMAARNVCSDLVGQCDDDPSRATLLRLRPREGWGRRDYISASRRQGPLSAVRLERGVQTGCLAPSNQFGVSRSAAVCLCARRTGGGGSGGDGRPADLPYPCVPHRHPLPCHHRHHLSRRPGSEQTPSPGALRPASCSGPDRRRPRPVRRRTCRLERARHQLAASLTDLAVVASGSRLTPAPSSPAAWARVLLACYVR
jgi:hypothetical protein